MTKEEYRSAKARLKEINSDYAELQKKIAKENRGMTDEELAKVKDYENETQRLKLACRSYELDEFLRRSKSLEQQQRANIDNQVDFAMALRSMMTGHGVPQGLEMFRNSNGGFDIPYSRAAAQMRAATIQDNSTVSPITPVYIKDYIDELEPELIIGQVGSHVQTGVEGQWNYPTIKGEDCDWLKENEEVKAMNVTLGVKSISPHRLPCRVDISNLAINMTGGEIRNIMVTKMKAKHSKRLNKTYMAITKPDNANAPIGPFVNVAEAQTIAATGDVKTLTRQNFIDLISAVNGSDIPVDIPAFLINWKTWQVLANTPIDKGSGRFVYDNQTKTIEGVKTVISNYVEDGVALYGNFGYSMIGQFGPMTMKVDATSIGVTALDVTSIVINSQWDFFTPYQEAFGKLTYTTA